MDKKAPLIGDLSGKNAESHQVLGLMGLSTTSCGARTNAKVKALTSMYGRTPKQRLVTKQVKIISRTILKL